MGSDAVVFWALIAISVSAFGAYLFWPGESLIRAMVKATAVGCLALLAALWGGMGVALALACSAVGDFALARPGERSFLLGMVAFAVAHVAYIILIFDHIDGNVAKNFSYRTFMAIFMICVGGALAIAYSRRAGALAWPVRGYVGVITLMVLAAIHLQGEHAWLIATGALLFALSDAIIGQQKFLAQSWRGQETAIWATYYLAQVLLLLGLTGLWVR